jgi:CRP/FNR family cyclic AMP-dependent transcriptional regulator
MGERPISGISRLETPVAVEGLAPLTERGWLATQPAAFQGWMARNGRWQVYAPQQVLYDAGEEPDALYGLGEGALEVTLPLVGDEPVTVHRAEPGFWLGESALLARTTRLLTLTAATEARVFRVPAARIRALVAEQPEAWNSLYELSHLNASLAVTLLAEALALSPRARLARMLLRLADGEGRVVARQEELARLIGMTRSSLQRALAGLAEAGAVSSGYGSLVVRDRAALKAMRDEA